jgi:hypothetical protein
MSGGSMDYLYCKVQEASFREDTPERKAFRKHLQLVADALHAIEWVDSGDFGDGDESEPIRKCLGPTGCLEAAIEEAHKSIAHLRDEIHKARELL